jgi:DNA gyrase subunit A
MEAESSLSNVVPIEEEMKRSYLEYSMSVIVGRALPDARDGLKPVHRRILYSMYELKNFHDKPYKKSARVVGDVIGKYHPHGDVAVYDAIVRMAQDFNMRYPLVDGQGNFGSIDGDSPAAMRYTEVRMSKVAEELLADIEKDTVDFMPNYDGSAIEPVVLPSLLPNLLMNGSAGIAVGMSTSIPPHNLTEVCDALIALIQDPNITSQDLSQIIKGPDLPTRGVIVGREGILEAYNTGKGIIKIRGRARFEERRGGKQQIIIEEIPYQVNKAKLIERITELIKEKKLEGIQEIRDESNREGIRVVLDLKREADPSVLLNRLYKFTQLEISFGINMLALVQGRPQVLDLKGVLWCFLEHRREVIHRRTEFELRKARERAHILEGLRKALALLDEVIELIRSSADPKAAKQGLIELLDITERQAVAILEMRLQRLTGLERERLEEEYQALVMDIQRYEGILADPKKVDEIVVEETKRIRELYGDQRLTEIVDEVPTLEEEDLIEEEDMVVTISSLGYIKRTPLSLYRAQRRGGKGMIGAKPREDDLVELLEVASSHDYLLFFTSLGKAYLKKVHELPEGGRASQGKHIVNFLDLSPEEKVKATLKVREFGDGGVVIMATRQGIVKRTPLPEYSRPKSTGIIALRMREGDELVGVGLSDGTKEVLLSTKQGRCIRFREEDCRVTGRASIGVIGIELEEGDEVVSMEVLRPQGDILTVTERGYGKRTKLEEFRSQSRGGKGIILIKVMEKNGPVIYSYQVSEQDQLVVMTGEGRLIRFKVDAIPLMGRATQGVKLMDLNNGEKVVGVARVEEE